MKNILTRPNWLEQKPRSENFLWLDKNENTDNEYLSWIKTNINQKILSTDYSTYPDLRDFYYSLAKIEGVNPNNILLSAGSDGAIRTVFQAYNNEGDKVFITNPSFAMYDVYCKLYKANTNYIEYVNTDGSIKFNFNSLLENIGKLKPKLICIPNPDSPTGSILKSREILTLLEVCKKNNSLLLIDEAYYPFYNYTSLEFLKEFKNLIICRTFSKAWGLAGIRVGYLISSEEQIKIMNLTRPMYEIGALQLKISQEIIKHFHRMVQSVDRLIKGKLFFEEEMRKLNFKTLTTYGNFSHVDFGLNRDNITSELDKYILYRKKFNHPALLNYSRFSSAPVSTMKQVVNLIKKFNEKI